MSRKRARTDDVGQHTRDEIDAWSKSVRAAYEALMPLVSAASGVGLGGRPREWTQPMPGTLVCSEPRPIALSRIETVVQRLQEQKVPVANVQFLSNGRVRWDMVDPPRAASAPSGATLLQSTALTKVPLVRVNSVLDEIQDKILPKDDAMQASLMVAFLYAFLGLDTPATLNVTVAAITTEPTAGGGGSDTKGATATAGFTLTCMGLAHLDLLQVRSLVTPFRTNIDDILWTPNNTLVIQCRAQSSLLSYVWLGRVVSTPTSA